MKTWFLLKIKVKNKKQKTKNKKIRIKRCYMPRVHEFSFCNTLAHFEVKITFTQFHILLDISNILL